MGFAEYIVAIWEVIKSNSPKLFFGLLITTAILLFGSNKFLEMIGLVNLTTENKTIIGLVFLASLVFSLIDMLLYIKDFANKKIDTWAENRNRLAHLKSLSRDEIELLKQYIENNVSTLNFELQDGIAQGLQAKNIIFRSSNTGLPGSFLFPYNIQPWVKLMIEKNQWLLNQFEVKNEA